VKPLKWRRYDPADEEVLWCLHHQMERRFHRTLDFPKPDGPQILSTIVGERDGIITNAITAEKEIEICHIGVNPLRATEAQEAAKILISLLQQEKIRIARSFVPAVALTAHKRQAFHLRAILKAAGMTQESEEMTSWYRWIEEAA